MIPIRITDLNYGGHTGNHIFLSLAHEARQQYLQSKGYTEMNIAGASLIMADAAVEYKNEVFHPETIKVSVTAAGFDRAGFDLFYLFEVEREGKWITAARIKTGMICFNYSQKKILPVPDEVIQKLSAPVP